MAKRRWETEKLWVCANQDQRVSQRWCRWNLRASVILQDVASIAAVTPFALSYSQAFTNAIHTVALILQMCSLMLYSLSDTFKHVTEFINSPLLSVASVVETQRNESFFWNVQVNVKQPCFCVVKAGTYKAWTIHWLWVCDCDWVFMKITSTR